MTVKDFLFNILAGVLASIIFSFLLWVTRKMWLSGFSGFYYDISRVYRNEKSALKDINKDIEESQEVKMLIIRGTSLTDDNGKYPSLWVDHNKKIEIVLSHEDNSELIEERAKATDETYDVYKQKIINSNKILSLKMKDYTNFEVYKHQERIPFKLIICDQSLYVFYYPDHGDSHSTNTVKYKNHTGAYNAFLNYYEILKSKDTTIQL